MSQKVKFQKEQSEKTMFQLTEVFNHFKQAFLLNKKLLLSIFLIELAVSFALYFIFREHLYNLLNLFIYYHFKERFEMFNVFISITAVGYLVIYLSILAVLQSIAVKAVTNTVLEQSATMKETILYGMKNSFRFIKASILIVIIVCSFYFMYFFFGLIPYLNYVTLIFEAFMLTIFFTKYRYIPYATVIEKQNIIDALDTSQNITKGHQFYSLFVFLGFASVILVINRIFVDFLGDHSLSGDYLVWAVVTVFIIALSFLLRLIDMVFFATGYKYEIIKMKNAREKFYKKW